MVEHNAGYLLTLLVLNLTWPALPQSSRLGPTRFIYSALAQLLGAYP